MADRTKWIITGPDAGGEGKDELTGVTDGSSGVTSLQFPENHTDSDRVYNVKFMDANDSSCVSTVTKITVKACGTECKCGTAKVTYNGSSFFSDINFTWDYSTSLYQSIIAVPVNCIKTLKVGAPGSEGSSTYETEHFRCVVVEGTDSKKVNLYVKGENTSGSYYEQTISIIYTEENCSETHRKTATLKQAYKQDSSCTSLNNVSDISLVNYETMPQAVVPDVNPNGCMAKVVKGSGAEWLNFRWCNSNSVYTTCINGPGVNVEQSTGERYLWVWPASNASVDRSTTLTFTIDGVSTYSQTVTVTQQAGGGGDCDCSVLKESIPSELNLAAEATSFTYTLFDSTVSSECKAKFGAIVDGTATWLSAGYNSSTGALTINVDALPSGTESRSGYVGIRYEGVSPSELCHTIDITQGNSDCGCDKLNNIYTKTNPLIIAGKGEDYAQVIDINPNGCNAQWIVDATPEGYDWPSSMRLSWSDSNTDLYPICNHAGCIGKRYLWVWSSVDVTTTEHHALRIQISDTSTHCFYLYVDQTAESCGCSNFTNINSSQSNPMSNNGYTNLQPIAQFTTEDCDALTLTVTADANWLTDLSVQRISTGSNDYFVLAKVTFNGSSSRNSTVTVKRNDNTTCGTIKVYQAGCEGSVDKYKTQLANLSISENGATIGSSYYKPNDTFTYRGNTYNCSTIFLSPKGGEYKFTMSGICESISAHLVNVGGDPSIRITFKKVDKGDGKYEYTISAETNTSMEYTSYVMSFGTTSLPNSYGLLRLYEDTDENLDGGSNKCIVSDYNTRLTIPNIMRIPSGGGATVAEINPARTNTCLANDLAESCDGVYYKSEGVPEWLTVRWSTRERLPHKHLEVSASNYSGTRFYDLPIGAPGGIVKSITVVQGVYAKFNVSSTTIGRTVGSTVRVPITATPEIDGGNFKVYKSDGTTITQDLYVEYLSSSEIALQVISSGVAANTKYYVKIIVNGEVTSTLEVTTQN